MEYTIITGATSGIGLELASNFARGGHNLILIARRLVVLDKIKSDLKASFNVSIECYSCDLSNLDDTVVLFKEINNKFQIRCLINNAGVGIFEGINELKLENIIYQNNINFTTPAIVTSILIDNINHYKGSIINICSILSYIPNNKKSIYVANKHALLGFSNSIRVEYPLVHVLTVHPATVKTAFFKEDYYKSKKVLSPQLVADKVYKAYKKRKRKLDIPLGIILIRILNFLFPKLVDQLNIKYFSNK
ncbi:MAG: oxidoreductase, short-chain dehydrogenase/reductase family [Haloplasmataceae bacterium]|jgi:short-subunit dehydrogenase|nr:oxidoreductase, short-chain dehydrogenase/reductase family [Haloplasmataceae bacterium]